MQKYLCRTQVCLFIAIIGAKQASGVDEYACATQEGVGTGSTCREDYHIEDIGYRPLLLLQQPQLRSLSVSALGSSATVTSSDQPIKLTVAAVEQWARRGSWNHVTHPEIFVHPTA